MSLHWATARAAARAGIEVDRNLPILWRRVMDAANTLARRGLWDEAAAAWWPGLHGDADLFFAGLTLPFIPGKSSRYVNFSPVPVQRYISDACARKLLREWGFEDYWRAKGWPPLCRPLAESDFECGPARRDAP